MYKLYGGKRTQKVLDLHRKKALFIKAVREFFYEKGFVEIYTRYIRTFPNLDPNVEPVKCEFGFLHTSPEYAMKKVLPFAEKVFQICRVFRKEEEDELHLTEFDMLEWYERYEDFNSIIKLSYELLVHLSESFNIDVLQFKNRRTELKKGYTVISLSKLFGEIFGEDLRNLQDVEDFERFAKLKGYKVQDYNWEDIFLLMYVDRIEPILSSFELPVFIIDFPVQLSAMAKAKEESPWLCERVELLLAGVEILNGYSELTDAEEQRTRLKREAMKRFDCWRKYIDVELLEALPCIEKAAGASLGIDRLFMLFFGIDDIRKILPPF